MSEKEKRQIRILFLGDCNVGKSSIISTCVSEDMGGVFESIQDQQTERVLYPVLLRSETSQSNYDTILVDTFGGETDSKKLKATIDSSHSVILVYDMTQKASVDRLELHWLPLINSINDIVSFSTKIFYGKKLDSDSDCWQ